MWRGTPELVVKIYYKRNMKIRLNKNTVRLRLNRSEVEKFGSEAQIEESTALLPLGFVYALKSDNGINALKIEFERNRITIYVPHVLGKEWVKTERVGIENWVDGFNGEKIQLLVEKDFKCLDHTAEDQSDNFENPIKRTYE